VRQDCVIGHGVFVFFYLLVGATLTDGTNLRNVQFTQIPLLPKKRSKIAKVGVSTIIRFGEIRPFGLDGKTTAEYGSKENQTWCSL
jgi:hypothetical protein